VKKEENFLFREAMKKIKEMIEKTRKKENF
jgi:hypothetical protein